MSWREVEPACGRPHGYHFIRFSTYAPHSLRAVTDVGLPGV